MPKRQIYRVNRRFTREYFILLGKLALSAASALPTIGAPFISVGKELYDFVTDRYREVAEENTKQYTEHLIQELERGGIKLNDPRIKSDEFLHIFLKAWRAVTRTRSREKIKRFALIVANATKENHLAYDETEEFIDILESISDRELQILLTLKKFETQNPLQPGPKDHDAVVEPKSKRGRRFWHDFELVVEREYKVRPGELPGMLFRLTRTGFYELEQGLIVGSGSGKGFTTPWFDKFQRWIETEDWNYFDQGHSPSN